MLKKQVAKGAIAACAAMAWVGVAFADGNVFWWKGADWGQFNNPANWDVGAAGEGNPDNLIPGADDAVAHSAVAKIDLGGNTYTINRRAKNFTGAVDNNAESLASTLHLTNGTLRVTVHHGPKLNIEVWNGATYDFVGTSYRDAYNIYSEAVEKIHSGGRIAVGSNSTFYLFGLKFTIEEGGTFLFNPKTFMSHPTTGKVLSFSNYGTLDAPNGIYLVSPGYGTAANTAPQFTQYEGITKLGGNVGRADSKSVKQLGFTLAGGKLEITNSVAFVNMSANPPNIADNASIEIEVKPDSLLDMTGMVFGEDVAITKTGAGDLKMKDTYPASLAVSAGRLVAAGDVSAGVSFAAGTQFRTDVEYVRLDDCESFSNATFMVDESLFQIGSTVLLSSDPAILAHAKEGLDAQLQAAGIQAEGRIANGALVVRSAYAYTFNASLSSDLTDPTAWRSGSVPSAETPIRISGAGTANFTAESTKFASITVEEGATLSVSGGTEESPVDLPPVELDYEARLLFAEGAVVQMTNTFTCVGNADVLPVFEVATNAKAIVQTPEPLYIRSSYDRYSHAGNDYGFRIKNVSLKWYGDIQTYYGDTRADTLYSRLLLGWAEAGETSYIAIDCRGGRYIAAGEANFASRTRTPLVLAVPQPGGTVVPIGTLYFRDYACVQRSSAAANGDYFTPGFFVGRWNAYNSNTAVAGNPPSVEFDVLFEGTVDLLMSGYCRIGGGAHVTLRGPSVKWRYVRTAFNDETLPRQLIMNDSGTLVVEDGAYLDICSSDSDRGFSASGTQDGQNVLTVSNSRLSLLHWYGSGKNVAEVDNSLLEIGYLRSSNTVVNLTGVFAGLRSVAISNTFTIAAADVDRANPDSQKKEARAVENWNRRVHIAPPLAGTGSLAVSNELSGAHAVYSMTVTVTNGANTATGRAFVTETAGGAPAALVFADGANWAGEVVADGRVSLTNLASETEAPASVSFGTLRLDANFPVRLWKSAGELTNDVINIAGGVSGGGGLVPVFMDGYAPELGDTFTLGTYPAEAALPRSAGGSAWRIYTEEQDGVTYLMLCYQPRGFVFSVK